MISDAGDVDFPKDGQQDICDAFRSVSPFPVPISSSD